MPLRLDIKYSKKSFLYLSTIILLLDICFVSLNYSNARKALHSDIQHHAEDHHRAFDVAIKMSFQSMLQLATFISQQDEWNQALLTGKQALEQIGNSTQRQAVQARQALLNKLQPAWKKMNQAFQIRQLHYYLAPDNVSFLRVHKPDLFGDKMEHLQCAVVDTNAERRPKFGFETGKIYSGLKGVAPIWAKDPETQQDVYVGAVEVGTSFDQMLPVLTNNFDFDAAVFLSKPYLEPRMQKELLQAKFNQYPNSLYYLEASSTTSKIALQVLNQTTINKSFNAPEARVVQNGQKFLSNSYFPLYDYQGMQKADSTPAGFILIWSDVSDMILAFRSAFAMNILYGILGFIIIELCLIWALKKERQLVKAEHSATIDSLTGLFNRRYYDMIFQRELNRIERTKEPLSLIICDIDKFKNFNDFYGHAAGDDCLRLVAQTLERQAKRRCDVVARYGGEEFAIILPSTDLETAATIAESMREAVFSLNMTMDQPLKKHPLTVSLGVACSHNLEPGESLFELADRHLYSAKSAGRNRTQSY
ncbi:diguanylate cyclase [Marinomonas sp.]